ncbi:MAG: hypothetical protein U0798_17155 [Gemmataceae bacterium]
MRRKKGKTGDLVRLQQLRQEAEQAKVAALTAQREADKERTELEERAAAFEREAKRNQELQEWRKRLKAGDVVHVQRFDKTGSVVRIDSRKSVVIVSIGLGQWEIPFEEINPVEQVAV